MPNQNQLTSTTQLFLDIHDIANDLLIMKDGATSLILTVSAMNFGLLAEEEQDAIIYSYAGLLNSLNYPIQIVIRSQTKDATKYLNLLKEQEEQASTELKRRAIQKYRDFVSNLIRERNVLDKKFYVVIPANALEMGLLPPQTVLPGVKSIDISTIERSVILEKARNILEPKRDHLIAQFNRIGLFARQLETQEIIQLFYTSYNPEAAEGQQLTDTANYTTPLVGTHLPVMPMAYQHTANQTPAQPQPQTQAPEPYSNPPLAQSADQVQPQQPQMPTVTEEMSPVVEPTVLESLPVQAETPMETGSEPLTMNTTPASSVIPEQPQPMVPPMPVVEPEPLTLPIQPTTIFSAPSSPTSSQPQPVTPTVTPVVPATPVAVPAQPPVSQPSQIASTPAASTTSVTHDDSLPPLPEI